MKAWITGMGAVAAAGVTPEEIFERIRAGSPAIRAVGAWDSPPWSNRLAGEIANFDPRRFVSDRKLHKLIRRTDFLGLYAAEQALARAGNAVASDDRSAVYVASGGGGYETQYDFLTPLAGAAGEAGEFGARAMSDVNPMWLLRSLPNNVLCHVGIRHGFKGPNTCFTSHSVSGVLALAEALAVIRERSADRALVVAHDAPIEPEAVRYYDAVGLLARRELWPFDRAHDGSLLGEGAAALLLEAGDSPPPAVLGEIVGSGLASEGEGLLPVRSDGSGLCRAIEAALDDAGVVSAEVGMIIAHGNGTPASDDSEAAAIARIFGSDPPPVTGFKWAIGHTLAASVLIDATLALVCLRSGVVPGVATLDEPSDAWASLPVSRSEQRARSALALVLSRGFSGTNGAIIVRGASV